MNVQRLQLSVLAITWLVVLNGCTDQGDELPGSVARAVRVSSVATDAGAGATCGNGRVDAMEECDPSAEGWRTRCDLNCRRTVYRPCDLDTENGCESSEALCASYESEQGSRFCAGICKQDAECPVLPGFAAGCNWAYCALLCNEGACPNGMTCLRGVTFLDFDGNERGARDVCIVESKEEVDAGWE